MLHLQGSPRIHKGRQRLLDLKSTAIRAQLDPASHVKSPHARKANPVHSRGQSLRERLKAKEQLKASLPSPPSKAEQERKAALQRVGDILPVLTLHRGSGIRTSQSLATLVQIVQTSARSPLSGSEVERCLSLLAEELTPGFVEIIEAGEVTAVVIDQSQRPFDMDARIEKAISAG